MTRMDFLLTKLSILIFFLIDFFYPTYQFILIVGFFILVDTVTGALLAKRRGKFTSRGLRRVFPKYLVYGLVILVAYIIERCFFPDFPALKLISGLVAWNELVSIDENFKGLYGFSVFKIFIDKLQRPIR